VKVIVPRWIRSISAGKRVLSQNQKGWFIRMKIYPGFFIVLEGIDGSGISTQAAKTAAALRERTSRRILLTKQPSTGPIGALIRQALNKRLQGFDEPTLALLFAADRQDHNNQELRAVLEAGGIVVCDRYLWSTLAYQGLALEREWLQTINRYSLTPDLTIFIKVNPETSLARIAAGRFHTELFEQEATLKSVYNNFIQLADEWRRQGNAVAEVDGEQPITAVTAQILAAVERLKII